MLEIQRGLVWDVIVTHISRVEILPVASQIATFITSRSQLNSISYTVEVTAGDPFDVTTVWQSVATGTVVPLGYKEVTITFASLIHSTKRYIRVRLDEFDNDGLRVQFEQELFRELGDEKFEVPEVSSCELYTCEMNCQTSCESSCELGCQTTVQLTVPSSSSFLSDIAPDSTWDSEDTAAVGRKFFVGAEVQLPSGFVYRCWDATPNAAVWKIVSAG